MIEFNIDKKLQELILTNLVAFGPKRYGPNFLLIKDIDEEENVFYQLNQRIIDHQVEEKIIF